MNSRQGVNIEYDHPGKLYVKGFGKSLTEDDIKAMFAPFGKLLQVIVKRDRDTQESKGFGFITFEDPAAAAEAKTALEGTETEGRIMHLDYAAKPQSAGGTAAGPGRGRGAPPATGGRPPFRDNRSNGPPRPGGFPASRQGHQERPFYFNLPSNLFCQEDIDLFTFPENRRPRGPPPPPPPPPRGAAEAAAAAAQHRFRAAAAAVAAAAAEYDLYDYEVEAELPPAPPVARRPPPPRDARYNGAGGGPEKTSAAAAAAGFDFGSHSPPHATQEFRAPRPREAPPRRPPAAAAAAAADPYYPPMPAERKSPASAAAVDRYTLPVSASRERQPRVRPREYGAEAEDYGVGDPGAAAGDLAPIPGAISSRGTRISDKERFNLVQYPSIERYSYSKQHGDEIDEDPYAPVAATAPRMMRPPHSEAGRAAADALKRISAVAASVGVGPGAAGPSVGRGGAGTGTRSDDADRFKFDTTLPPVTYPPMKRTKPPSMYEPVQAPKYARTTDYLEAAAGGDADQEYDPYARAVGAGFGLSDTGLAPKAPPRRPLPPPHTAAAERY